MSQLIDLETAKEFMKEILEKANKDDLIAIASELEEKSAFFQSKLGKDNIGFLDKDDLAMIFRNIFATRRRVNAIMEAHSVNNLKQAISELIHGEEKTDVRFQQFYDHLGELDSSMKCDLAGELLHYTNPDKYWLWARWMWDPKNKTGALPLLTSEDFDLEASNMGEMYMKVGRGVAFVHSVAEFAGFQFISRSLFGTDVFLSCVYVVYAYTVLRMRMTQEFNKVMPGLSEFSRRILGIYKIPETV